MWENIRTEVESLIMEDLQLKSYLHPLVLNHENIVSSVVNILARKLRCDPLPQSELEEIMLDAMSSAPAVAGCLEQDISQYVKKDPACLHYSTPLLFYKGFLSIAAYRAANRLWLMNRKTIALYIQSLCSEVFGVDIHPAATIEGGVMIDHATSVVIGETCTIESGVSLFQGVTLGGRGYETGKRHPNIKKDATIYSSSSVLGNVTIGEKAIVAAGSMVLKNVDSNTTVAGIPAVEISNEMRVIENKEENGD